MSVHISNANKLFEQKKACPWTHKTWKIRINSVEFLESFCRLFKGNSVVHIQRAKADLGQQLYSSPNIQPFTQVPSVSECTRIL